MVELQATQLGALVPEQRRDVAEVVGEIGILSVHDRFYVREGGFPTAIIKLVRSEDFERLYVEHAQRLFGFLVYRTGDRALAEDLVSETFEAAFKARRRYDPKRASESTWLYTIALNRMRDHARRRSVETGALPGLAEDQLVRAARPTDLEHVDDRDRIARALVALSEEERECVALRFGADLTLREIATTLRQPMTTIEGRVYRALRKLRAELDRVEPAV